MSVVNQKVIYLPNDKFQVVTIYDKTPWLAENYEDRKSESNGFSPKRTTRRIGSIPIADIHKMCGGDPFMARQLMNDPEALQNIIRLNPDKYKTCHGAI